VISASRGVETHPAVEEGTPFRGSRGPGRMHSRAAGRPGDAAVRPKTQEDEVGGAGASARAHARGRPHLSNRECRCKGQRARGAPGTHAPRLRRSLHHSLQSMQSRPRTAPHGEGRGGVGRGRGRAAGSVGGRWASFPLQCMRYCPHRRSRTRVPLRAVLRVIRCLAQRSRRRRERCRDSPAGRAPPRGRHARLLHGTTVRVPAPPCSEEHPQRRPRAGQWRW